ncbi:hypothetical protein ACOSP7_031612 [Xanthoceras sorbifolium]
MVEEGTTAVLEFSGNLLRILIARKKKHCALVLSEMVSDLKQVGYLLSTMMWSNLELYNALKRNEVLTCLGDFSLG